MKKLNTFAGPGERLMKRREVVLDPRVSGPDETHEQGGGGAGL